MIHWSRTTLTLVLLLWTRSVAFPQTVRIGVFGLFHPQEITLAPANGSALILCAEQNTFVLEKSSGVDTAHVRVAGNVMILEVGSQIIHTTDLHVSTRQNGPADLTLSVPGKISRRFHGTLEVKPNSGFLLAVVGMDLETAVASVVGAESAPDMPVEALKAQAVVTRSYFVAAKGRHRDFDFCDTTHCQFLRSPPDPGTLVARAVAATRGLVLAYESEPIATMYTRSCSGRTRTPADVGLPAASYPYYSVDCKYCREHLPRWQRQISRPDATKLRAANERERLEVDRRLGWNTVPSNTFTRQNVGDRVILRGAGQGHGIGLCQAGAGAMARDGAFFSEILAHYYPNTAIVGLGRMAASDR